MIMVDTSVWIDYFNGVNHSLTQKLDYFLLYDIVVTGDIILAETLQGFRSDHDFIRAKEVLLGLECFELAGRRNAIKSADNYRMLRKRGVTIRKTTDMIIATFCIHSNIPLLYADRDFDPMINYLGLLSAANLQD